MRRWSLAALFALAFSATAFAEIVYVEPASGPGLTDSDLVTVTELVRNAIPQVSHDRVTENSGEADFSIRPRVLRLGNAVILNLSKVRKGAVVYQTELKAANVEELDKVAGRATRSVINEENAKESPRVGEITNQEALDGAQRKAVRKSTFLAIGPAWMDNVNTSGAGFGLGAAWCFDVNVAILRLEADAAFNGSGFIATGGIGASYFLTMTDVAPYLSADFGAGAAKIDSGGSVTQILQGQTVGGFSVGVGGGVELLRTSAASVDIGLRAAYLLHVNSLGTPASYMARIGLYF